MIQKSQLIQIVEHEIFYYSKFPNLKFNDTRLNPSGEAYDDQVPNIYYMGQANNGLGNS